jgi:hypothetical protein
MTPHETAELVRSYCENLGQSTISTNELIANITPIEFSPQAIRQLYHRVSELAMYEPPTGLADCCHKNPEAETILVYGKPKKAHRWLWHAPRAPHDKAKPFKNTCPHCGGLL